MSTNAVEKNAQKLNLLLRTEGKKQGKAWRMRIRGLLSQTFEALNAKPLDGARCLELSQRIEAELAAIESGEPLDITESEYVKPAEKRATSVYAVEPERIGEADSPADSRMSEAKSESQARMSEAESADAGEARIGEAESGAGDASPAEKQEKKVAAPEEAGLFDLIRVEIRCFFTLRACIKPPYIGQFVKRADAFAKSTQARIDKFINVLSKNEDDFAAKTEVEIGYNDDLLPDMPERGLVLHPKKKKKK